MRADLSAAGSAHGAEFFTTRGYCFRRASVANLAVLTAAVVCLVTGPKAANAASTSGTPTSYAYSIPGVVWIALDDVNTHTLIIEDSIEEGGTISSAFFGAAVVGAATADLPLLLEPVPPLVGASNPWAAAGALIVGLVLLAKAVQTKVAEQGEGAEVGYQPSYAIVIKDVEGHPLIRNSNYGDGCRDHVRHPEPPYAPDTSTVKCDVIPSDGGAPDLNLWGGNKRDRIVVNLKCVPICFENQKFYLRDGNDAILGSSAADYIQGMGGNDLIFGRQADDNIIGCHENDFYDNGGGDGVFQRQNPPPGQTDNDVLYGGGGQDVIYGCFGNDIIAGGDGNDNRVDAPFYGQAVALHGGGGNDVVVGGDGNDRMEGGEDRDTILAREADFGGTNHVDELGDCGPNILRPVTGKEYFRYSQGDTITSACTEEISMVLDWITVIGQWDRETPWPWYQ